MAAVARYKARNSTEKLVLFLIANYADEEGSAFPSQERLAQDGSMDVRTVQRTLAALEACDPPAIARERRQRDNGSRTSDRITLLLGRPDRFSGRGEKQDDNLSGKAPAQSRGVPGAESPPEPVTDPLEPATRSANDIPENIRAWAASIWAESPDCGKRSSTSRAEVARALRAATESRGHNPALIAEALRRYYADPETTREKGRYAKGVHRMIENDRCLEWAPDSAEGLPGPRTDLPKPGTKAPADGGDSDIGTLEQPGPRRQRSWMEEWRESPFKWQPHVRGPAPGEAGCRVSAELQREFGAVPVEGA